MEFYQSNINHSYGNATLQSQNPFDDFGPSAPHGSVSHVTTSFQNMDPFSHYETQQSAQNANPFANPSTPAPPPVPSSGYGASHSYQQPHDDPFSDHQPTPQYSYSNQDLQQLPQGFVHSQKMPSSDPFSLSNARPTFQEQQSETSFYQEERYSDTSAYSLDRSQSSQKIVPETYAPDPFFGQGQHQHQFAQQGRRPSGNYAADPFFGSGQPPAQVHNHNTNTASVSFSSDPFFGSGQPQQQFSNSHQDQAQNSVNFEADPFFGAGQQQQQHGWQPPSNYEADPFYSSTSHQQTKQIGAQPSTNYDTDPFYSSSGQQHSRFRSESGGQPSANYDADPFFSSSGQQFESHSGKPATANTDDPFYSSSGQRSQFTAQQGRQASSNFDDPFFSSSGQQQQFTAQQGRQLSSNFDDPFFSPSAQQQQFAPQPERQSAANFDSNPFYGQGQQQQFGSQHGGQASTNFHDDSFVIPENQQSQFTSPPPKQGHSDFAADFYASAQFSPDFEFGGQATSDFTSDPGYDYGSGKNRPHSKNKKANAEFGNFDSPDSYSQPRQKGAQKHGWGAATTPQPDTYSENGSVDGYGPEGSDDDADDDGKGALEFQGSPPQRNLGTREYEVIFHEQKLGMLLERKDVWSPGSEKRVETTVVKLVVDGEPACQQGVKVGSRVLSINGRDCTKLNYAQTLDMVKSTQRPIFVVLEASEIKEEDTSQGWCLYKSSRLGAPRNFQDWKRRYFVIGGAVAKPNVLQVYHSKTDYETVVVNMFQNKKLTQEVKAWKLTKKFKTSGIKTKNYNNRTAAVKYFYFKTPKSQMKHICFAAETTQAIQILHTQTKSFTS